MNGIMVDCQHKKKINTDKQAEKEKGDRPKLYKAYRTREGMTKRMDSKHEGNKRKGGR